MRQTLVVLAFSSLTLFGSAASAQIRIELPILGEINFQRPDLIKVATNPLGIINPTGIPSEGDFAEMIVRNPEAIITILSDPRYAAYYTVAKQITTARNSAIANGARPLPPHVRSALSSFYPPSLLDSVRWSTDWNIVQNTPATAMMFADHNVRAITYINAIVFRSGEEASDISLWAHEIYHAQQYKEWGVLEFAKQWTDNSSNSGPVEGPAYAKQAQVRSFLAAQSIPAQTVLTSAGKCESKSKGMAVCDLYANAKQGPVDFTVSGTARATSNGTRSGRMWFVVSTRGRACNSDSGTEYGVDNATELSGPGFQCKVTVQPGNMQRVFLVAPNTGADADFVRATVQYPAIPGAW